MKKPGLWMAVVAVSSSCVTALLTSGPTSRAADPPATRPDNPARLSIDEHDLHFTYMNAYRVHTTAEEVVLDVGFNMLDPNPKPGDPNGVMLFRLSDRVVMTYSTAKRLHASFGRVIQAYEQKYGEIKVEQLPVR